MLRCRTAWPGRNRSWSAEHHVIARRKPADDLGEIERAVTDFHRARLHDAGFTTNT